MKAAYYGCNKLTGAAVFGPNVTDLVGAYGNCTNLTNIATFHPENITNFS
jgi:hypothetical protein